MMHKVHKLYWDFEKEENWINEMASQGLMLKSVCWGTYFFEKADKGEYIYRIELLDTMPKNPQSQAYFEFMEESGIELVSTYWRWAYFRKKTEDGAFDIFSDITSKLRHYKRVFTLLATFCFLNLCYFISNIIVGISTSVHSKYYYGYYENGELKQHVENGPLGFNFYLSLLNLTIAIVLGVVVFRLFKKIIKLKKRKKIVE